jgi:hypothetical protein
VEDDRRARQRRTRRRRWRVRGGTAGARPLEGGDNQVFAQGQRRASHFTQLTSFSPRAASRSSSTTGGTQGIRSRVPPRPRPPLPPQRTRRQQLREAARGSLRPFFHGGTSRQLSGGRWRGGGTRMREDRGLRKCGRPRVGGRQRAFPDAGMTSWSVGRCSRLRSSGPISGSSSLQPIPFCPEPCASYSPSRPTSYRALEPPTTRRRW